MPRPRKNISQSQFETLCGIGCTKTEICAVFDCDEKTLTAWCKRTYKMGFSEAYKTRRDKGNASLRRLQFKEAEKGNVTMLIWLGKQWLGQTEKPAGSDPPEPEINDEVEELLRELDEE